MKLRWLGHSAFRVETAANTILIDPFFAHNPAFQGQDIKEINLLNHYIGMKDLVAEDFTEFKWMPFVIGALVIALAGADGGGAGWHGVSWAVHWPLARAGQGRLHGKALTSH